MSHIIQKFGDWKKVNEDDTPGRTRERGDNRNKVVAIPIDKTTLKLKIVNDADVIGAGDKLTIEGFDAILDWLKGQGKLLEYYPLLAALTLSTETRTLSAQEKAAMQSAIIIYDVSKDTDRKQVIMFRIADKTSLQGSNQAVTGGINPLVRFVKSSELTQALGGTLLNVKPGSNIVIDKSAPTFTLPYASAGILNSTKAEVIQFIISAYKKIKKEPLAFNTPLMVKVKDEILAKKLGIASQLFVKSLNAGFGILDAQLGEDLEVDITKTLYDKLQAIPESKEVYLGLTATRIVETLSTVIMGFDVDAFLAVAKKIKPDTGDITVPEGGFTFGMKGNIELMKFQKFLYTKLKNAGWSKVAVYANFAAKAGDGKAGSPIGDYGKTTAALIEVLKTGLKNPFWDEREPNTISAEFVKRMQTELKSITESRKPISYLGLDGNSIIINEDLGVPPTAATVSATPAAKPRATANSNSKPAASNKPPEASTTSGTTYVGLPGNYYSEVVWKLIDNVWHFKKIGTADTAYHPDLEAYSMQQLIARTRKGWFIRLSWDGKKFIWAHPNNRYRFGSGTWQVSKDKGVTWTNDTPAEQKILKSLYGATPLLAAQTAMPTPTAVVQATTAEIDAGLRALYAKIKSFIESENKFAAYTNAWYDGGDDETGAWSDVLYPEWTNSWIKTLNNLQKKWVASTAIGAPDKAKYEKSWTMFNKMFSVAGSDTLYTTFQGGTSNDTYKAKLYLSGSQVDPISIETDFGYE